MDLCKMYTFAIENVSKFTFPDLTKLTGPTRYYLLPSRPHPSRPRLELLGTTSSLPKTTKTQHPEPSNGPSSAYPCRIGVTIFAFITGYVCALKPLKLSRAADTTAAFVTVLESAFRRPPHLILPVTITLVISWTVAQLAGLWLRIGLITGSVAPDLEDSLWKEVVRLGQNFLSTWTTGYMAYDDQQWALAAAASFDVGVYPSCGDDVYAVSV